MHTKSLKDRSKLALGCWSVALFMGACGAGPGPGDSSDEPSGEVALAQKNFTPTGCTSDSDVPGDFVNSCVLAGGERTECSGGVAYCCRPCTKEEGCEERCSQDPGDLDRPAVSDASEPVIDTLGDEKDKVDAYPEPSIGELGLSPFVGACESQGGALTSTGKHSACCTLCTEKDGCNDFCVDLEDDKVSPSEESAKVYEALVEKLEASGTGSTARNNDEQDRTKGCKWLCGKVWDGCDVTPIYDDWCWLIAMSCVTICLPGVSGDLAP